jgi:SulP family sulfate permease
VFFMGAGLGILFFGIIEGILIGVVLSLLLLIARSSRTSIRELGRDPKSGVFRYVGRHQGLETIPGVLVARVDGPLFFADADRFRATLEAMVKEGQPQRVIVDAEAVHLTDTDGADILIQVAGELQAHGIGLAVASVHPPVLELWERAGLLQAIGDHAVYESVGEAVRDSTPAEKPRTLG